MFIYSDGHQGVGTSAEAPVRFAKPSAKSLPQRAFRRAPALPEIERKGGDTEGFAEGFAEALNGLNSTEFDWN